MGERWSVLALVGPGKAAAVAEWFGSFGPSEVAVGPGISPRVVRASFEALPDAWRRLMTAISVHSVTLTPDGSASVFIEDTLENVERFVEAMQRAHPEVRSRKTDQAQALAVLTARQLEVLALAVASGYYELPHRLNLRELAKKLDLSVGAVSELLRRGEGLIITHFVDAANKAQWDRQESRTANPT